MCGPQADGALLLVLDTGAARTAISRRILRTLGYDCDRSARSLAITTASCVERWPVVGVERLAALGQLRYEIDVLAADVSLSAGVDCLRGLYFFHDLKLCRDLIVGFLYLI